MQNRVRAEVSVLRDGPAGPYTRGLVKEAMRLFPVAPFLTRIAKSDFSLAGYNISPGTLILLSTFAMGRDEKLFPQPQSVRPER